MSNLFRLVSEGTHELKRFEKDFRLLPDLFGTEEIHRIQSDCQPYTN